SPPSTLFPYTTLFRSCRESFTTGEKYSCDDDRNRVCPFRRQWSVRSVAGCIEHDLGRESQTGTRYLGILAHPLFVLRDGWGRLRSEEHMSELQSLRHL